MLLLVGLGNPGPRYARNRHNIGVLAVDAIADRHRFQPPRTRFQGEVREGLLGGGKALILKPQTYMNESGRSVGAAATFYKIPPADVVVFYDEIDLAPGKVRAKQGGGAAGHNGIRSVTAAIGPDFHRVRLGVGRPFAKEQVHNWVLGDFAKVDADWLGPLLAALADNADLVAAKDFATYQNRVHLAVAPQREPRGAPPPETA